MSANRTPPPASTPTSLSTAPPTAAPVRSASIGCVSFLNAKPLIEGLEDSDNPRVKFDVPSRLLDDLQSGLADIALCPVIDFQRSETPLSIVPVGGIGCNGVTLTVRLFSQKPLDEITTIYADTDSHTSVTLLRILLQRLHGCRPRVIDYHAREHVAEHRPIEWPQAMLLIGDKVVTDSPPAVRYPHQLDLGHAWRQMTGLPFVFAVWMARQGEPLGDLPELLRQTRLRNTTPQRIDAMVARHADRHGWPHDLAKQYLGHWLRYDIGPDQLEAMRLFAELAAECGLIPHARPLALAAAHR